MTQKLENMEFTGERFVPSLLGDIELEHLHRYLLACKTVEGKIVLDIASGEGYGSAMLARTARKVIGVDISQEAVSHAQKKYLADNLLFRLGSCSDIPLDDASVDVVVSFETIEHHDEHEAMMREVKRVLRPNGVLIISSPDKLEYSDKPKFSNIHHVKELYRDEFKKLLTLYFVNHRIFGQRVIYGSAIFCEDGVSELKSYELGDELFKVKPGVPNAIYLIAVASDAALPSLDSGILEQSVKDTEIIRKAIDCELMLSSKDVAWTARLEQCSQDYQLEIVRIAAERDSMLKEKDFAWKARLEQCSQDYRLEIVRIAAERDLMLNAKEEIYDRVLENITPKVSVVTVNFNGKKFLKELINSLSRQTIQPEEVIVVDNNSTDGSVAYLKENFPFVRIVQSGKNVGFAGGNNIGVQTAKYPLIALINNDTVVDPSWLEHLVGTWVNRTSNSENIGAVSPKIRFFSKFLSFRFNSELFTPGGSDCRSLGVAIDFSKSGVMGVPYIKPIAVSGFHNEEQWSEKRCVRWTSGPAVLMLPIDQIPPVSGAVLRVVVATAGKFSGAELRVECEGLDLGVYPVTNEFVELNIEIPTNLLDSANWVINNAGSRLDQYGNAADVGMNQPDIGQFDGVRDLEAFCGCSVLIPRHIFLGLGGFDERFFMYYEDTDLSWRLRNSDLKIVYQPLSVVRHIHAGSSVEWSPSFRYHVVRNFRLVGLKNAGGAASLVLLARLLYSFLRCALQGMGRNLRHNLTGSLGEMDVSQIEFIALRDAIRMTPSILLSRFESLFMRRNA